MSGQGFTKLFTNAAQVDAYSLYRPRYSAGLARFIAANLAAVRAAPLPRTSTNAFTATMPAAAPARVPLAVDLGCGSGQLTTLLADVADRVVGTDVSAEQVASATAHERVSYSVGAAEDVAAAAASGAAAADAASPPVVGADIVTVAQAFHWLDFAKAYDAIAPVITSTSTSTSDGVLAVITYDNPVLSLPAANALVNQWLYNDVLGAYWNARREHVNDRYSAIQHAIAGSTAAKWVSRRFVFADEAWLATPAGAAAAASPETTTLVSPGAAGVDAAVADALCMRRSMPVSAVIGYLRSWSAYTTYRKQKPEAADPLVELEARLVELYAATEQGAAAVAKGEEPLVDVTYPVTVLLAAPSRAE